MPPGGPGRRAALRAVWTSGAPAAQKSTALPASHTESAPGEAGHTSGFHKRVRELAGVPQGGEGESPPTPPPHPLPPAPQMERWAEPQESPFLVIRKGEARGT